MQASTDSPVTNSTTTANTTTVTKSKEQILIQSSGAMIAVIVIGIIIILAILLIILKTYNRYTHASRVLGSSTKPRPKMSQSTAHSSMPLSTLGVSSVSATLSNSNSPALENGLILPPAEQGSVEENHIEQFSTTSDSTVVTIHDRPSLGDT